MTTTAPTKITEGQCRCGIKVNRIENCPFSIRHDGVRYDYANRMSKHINIFRCNGCDQVIYDTWRPLKPKQTKPSKSAKSAAKMTPGDDLHLTLLMTPHGLNLVTGQDRQQLLAYGRAAFEAGKKAQATHGN